MGGATSGSAAASALTTSLTAGAELSLGHHARKLSRSVYSGSVTSALREAIIGGELPTGSPLVERTLAGQLGISRGPVRSALAILEGEGLVVTRPNGRMVVDRFDVSALADLLAVRYQLESTALRWGAARNAALDPVLAVLAEMEAEGTSTPRLVDLDIHFHRSLLELSGSRFLLQSWLALAPVLHTVIALGNRRLKHQDPVSNYNRIISSHREIVRPLQQGTLDQAVDCLADQFQFTCSMFDPSGSGHNPAKEDGPALDAQSRNR